MGTDLQGAVPLHWGWVVDLLGGLDCEGLAVPVPVLLGDEGCQGVDCCLAPVCSQPLGFHVECQCQQGQTAEHLELAAPKQLAAALVERNPV